MRYFKTIIWFLKRPQYLPQIFQVFKRRKNKVNENKIVESTKWCKEVCISKNDALKELFGHEVQLTQIDQSKYYEFAKNAEYNCPVKMGGEGSTDFIYTVTNILKPKKIFESGVAYGWSSFAFLLAIKEIPGSKLISNDMPYIKMENDNFIGCVVHSDLQLNWELQKLPDVKGIPLALKKFNNSIDICHYDSDKSYTGRMFGYPLLWEALSPGGVFISDDVQDNLAFKDFAIQKNVKPVVFEHNEKYVGVLMK